MKKYTVNYVNERGEFTHTDTEFEFEETQRAIQSVISSQEGYRVSYAPATSAQVANAGLLEESKSSSTQPHGLAKQPSLWSSPLELESARGRARISEQDQIKIAEGAMNEEGIEAVADELFEDFGGEAPSTSQ